MVDDYNKTEVIDENVSLLGIKMLRSSTVLSTGKLLCLLTLFRKFYDSESRPV